MTDGADLRPRRPCASGSSPSAGSPRRRATCRTSTCSRCCRCATACALALVEARFHAGTHELYQLLVRGGQYDAMHRPGARRAASASARGSRASTGGSPSTGPTARRRCPSARRRAPIGAEQSNSSIVLDDAHVLKVFRRLEPGDNPELEMLRFLTARGFPNIAALHGWYELRGDMLDATLGVAQELVADGRDGWELALDELAYDPDRLLGRLGDLGRVVGRDAHRAGLRRRATPTSPPRSRPTRRWRCWRRRSTSRSSRRSSTCRTATRRSSRSPAAARRCATACSSCRTSAPAGGSSATTATCTSARRCWPATAG